MYGFVGNDGVNQTDLLGQKILTKEKSEAFRKAIEIGLEKITDSDLYWCERKSENDWILKINTKGTDSLWKDLEPAINGLFRAYNIVRWIVVDNAEAETSGWFGRDVRINENVMVDLPVEKGTDKKGNPKYVDQRVPFNIVLWHELVGHSIKGKGHPKEQWNYYSNRNKKPLPNGWGTVDPTIVIENEARKKLNLPNRRPQYYE